MKQLLINQKVIRRKFASSQLKFPLNMKWIGSRPVLSKQLKIHFKLYLGIFKCEIF